MSKRLIYSILALTAVASLTLYSTRNDFGLGRNMEIMVNLMRAVNTEYVDSVASDKLMRHGADGILRNLDPYCTYLSEEDMKGFRRRTPGK